MAAQPVSEQENEDWKADVSRSANPAARKSGREEGEEVKISTKDASGKTYTKKVRIHAKRPGSAMKWQYQVKNLDGTPHEGDQWFDGADLFD